MHWDRLVNRGWFPLTIPLLLEDQPSCFATFNRFSIELERQLGLSGFGMVEDARMLLDFLTEELRTSPAHTRELLREDYLAGDRRINVPHFLRTP